MKRDNQFTSADRDFFRLVSQLVFSNQFETDRIRLAHQIVGRKYKSEEPLYDHLSSKVRQKLDSVVTKKRLSWKAFSGEDQELLRIALLYDAYRSCHKEFDELIAQQINTGHEPLLIPFADRVLTLLQERHFSKEQSLRYFEYFYQLRRAWHFICYGLIGNSPSMTRLKAHLWRTLFTSDAHWYESYLWDRMEDFSTFLIGETGTGKGTAAAAIGRAGYISFDEKKNRFSESFMENFIEINLSQFPESLIESELFGHQKGAFTGAIESYQGVFALCSKFGSIFLDEIGDATVSVQIKLLKVLEERKFTPVGSHKKMHFSGRVITATNKDISELKQDELFRRDFYYRLSSNVINVPPLRKQIREDPSTLEALLKHTIKKITGKSPQELVSAVLEVIHSEVSPDYNWPGNVRELEQAVRCILLNKDHCGEIDGWCEVQKEPLTKILKGTNVSAQQLLTAYCVSLYEEYRTYGEVARITQLDARTVKKYIQSYYSQL